MARYTYSAIELGTGREHRGEIEGATRSEAASLLKKRGLAPMALDAAIVKSRAAAGARRQNRRRLGRSVGRRELMLFTRQLATLVNAGLPLSRGLEVLRRQERNPAFERLLGDLAEAIAGGATFSEALQRHPRVFDSLFVTMAQAGEAGGVLGMVLDRQAQFMEKAERLRGRVKTAMMYPVIILSVAMVILWVLMVVVVPKFELIFAGLLRGQALPALTQSLLSVSGFVHRQVWWLLGAGAVAVLGFRQARKSERGRQAGDRLILRVPLVGDLALKSAVARVTRTLGSLLASGVPILDALAISRATSGNLQVASALDQVLARIKQGDGVAKPLEETGIFPAMVTGMIQVGEETGALPEMLRRVADTYDEEVDNAVAGLTSVLEPAMVVLMAAVVGVIVIALFLPIVSIIQHLH